MSESNFIPAAVEILADSYAAARAERSVAQASIDRTMDALRAAKKAGDRPKIVQCMREATAKTEHATGLQLIIKSRRLALDSSTSAPTEAYRQAIERALARLSGNTEPSIEEKALLAAYQDLLARFSLPPR